MGDIPHESSDRARFYIRDMTPSVADSEQVSNPHKQSDVADVADRTGMDGGSGQVESVDADETIERSVLEEPEADSWAEAASDTIREHEGVREPEPELDGTERLDEIGARFARPCRCPEPVVQTNEDGDRSCLTCGHALDLPRTLEEIEAEDQARKEAARLAGEEEDRQAANEKAVLREVAELVDEGVLLRREERE
jgi:hypothetical protein